MSFGQPLSVLTYDQRHMDILRGRITEQLLQMDMSTRAKQQVISTNDLGDTLSGIINDNSQVVSRNTIISQKHHVVDHGCGRTSN